MTRRRLRIAAWTLFAAGIFISRAGLRVDPRVPPSRGGYIVLACDLHVHSFPGDGALAPLQIAREARRRRLNVVALTNHNAMYSWRLARWLDLTAATPDVLLLPGDEVTGVGFHIAAVGVDRPVPWHVSIPEVVGAIHAQGGAAIAAHPDSVYSRAFDETSFAAVDGVEASNPEETRGRKRRFFEDAYLRAARAHPGIAAIGSSDFHTFPMIGFWRTFLFVREPTRQGVVEAIRAGRSVACDDKGATHGSADLAALVSDECRAEADTRTDPDTALSWFGDLCSWSALLALVLCGVERD
jgi:predicted metal-dependent phosphoesterase TrpH